MRDCLNFFKSQLAHPYSWYSIEFLPRDLNEDQRALKKSVFSAMTE